MSQAQMSNRAGEIDEAVAGGLHDHRARLLLYSRKIAI
jgi:hypothetical protein